MKKQKKYSRKKGNSPTFIKISAGRIRYPRSSVMAFLAERINEGAPQQQEESNV
jgi:hypothetical protein